jgi:hypothetical protein
MSLAAVEELARDGRLYPSTILHGGDLHARLELAQELARALLCEAPPQERPCGACRHCSRIEVATPSEQGKADAEAPFHPDFRVLSRDLKASTSVEAVRALLRLTQQHPFEARGQVLVVAEAETLTGEAGNALLKTLEEPPTGAPRHFLLLAPTQEALLPTLRSRSWAVYLGPPESLDQGRVETLADAFAAPLEAWESTGNGVYLLLAAAALEGAGGWEDLRAQRPWGMAAAAVARCAHRAAPGDLRRRLWGLAQDLLEAPRWRLRNVLPQRILEGLLARRLAPVVPAGRSPARALG